MIRRIALALLVPAALISAQAAVPASAAAAPTQGAYVRLAHLSPDTPHVDVYVASVADPVRSFTAKQVGYGAVSDYRLVQADTYTVSMRAAGADPSTPPVLSTTVTVRDGAAYTVAGLGKYADLRIKVLDDDLSLPPDGQARLRVVQATTTAPSFDVGLKGGATIATGVAFAQTTAYTTVPAGPSTLVAGPSGQAPTELPVTLAATGVYTVLLVDKGGKLATELHADAVGAGVVPSGGVETGLGGTAGGARGWLGWLVPVLLLGAAAAGSAALVRRVGKARRGQRA